jgi:uncharacterized oxidoreductase
MNLKSQTILITGGTSGIGYALVKKLVQFNKVLVVARNTQRLDALKKEFPDVFVYTCALENKLDIDRVFGQIQADHKNITVVINNAGIQMLPTFLDKDFSYSGIENEIAINLTAPICICSLMLKPLFAAKVPATIVNITSGLGLFPKKSSAVYCATKAGLRNFTKSFRYQMEGTNIKIIEAILPLVDTPMTIGRGKNKLSAEAVAEAIIAGIEKGIEEIYVGKAKWIPILARLSPALMASIMKSS